MSSFESRRFRLTIALGIGLTLLCCGVDQLGWLTVLDNWFYDLRALECQTFTPKPTDRIVHVDIDDAALDPGAVGRWPWPRGTLAQIIDEIGNAKPAALGIDIHLSDPEESDPAPTTNQTIDDDALLETSLSKQKNASLVAAIVLPSAQAQPRRRTAAVELMQKNLELTPEDLSKALRLRGVDIEDRNEAQDVYAYSLKTAMHNRVWKELQRESLTDDALASRLLPHADLSIRLPVISVLNQAAAAFRSVDAFERFGIDAGNLSYPVVPGDFYWIPLQRFSKAVSICGFANHEFFRDPVIRSLPMVVEVDHRLYPQFGLAFGCTLAGADIRTLHVNENSVTIAKAGGGKIRIPTHSFHSQKLNATFSAIADVPWFGDSNHLTMYDWPNHVKQANHLSVNLIWDTCKTVECIKKNNRIFDDAIQDVFGGNSRTRLDPDFADSYLAKLPADDDTTARIKTAVAAIAKLNNSGFIKMYQGVKRTPEDDEILNTLLAAKKAFAVGDNNRGFYRQLADFRATLSDKLAGKGVLLGWTAEGVEGVDNVPTSLHSRCPGVVVHGVIAEAVLSGRWWRRAPEWVDIALILVFGTATSFFVAQFRPSRGFAATLLLLLSYLLFNGYVLFGLGSLLVPVAGSVVAISVVFSGCTLQGVIFESIERNRVATEVAIINREMDLAHQVQAALIPKHPPVLDGLEAFGWTQPASTTGGDCYDLWRLADGRLAILLADASGHGLAPAMIVSQVRTLVRALCDLDPHPCSLLRRVNARIADDVESGRFVTAFLGFLSSDGLLEYASAGHGPQFCYACSGTDAEDHVFLDSTGTPLGFDLEWMCDDPGPPVQLPAGCTLIVFSDGIFEAMDPSRGQFGIDRLKNILHDTRGQTGQLIINRIIAAVESWQQNRPPADDQTVVIARRIDVPADKAAGQNHL